MKLNEKGRELYNIWWHNYCKENDRLGGDSSNHDYVEGWCIIDNDDYVKTLTDECGLLIFGYEDDAIYTVKEWMENRKGEDICAYDFTFTEVLNELKKYFECVENIEEV